MAKLMAPNIRIDWYPEGHFQDVHNPTIEELNSGVNLSCAIVTGYTLDFTDSNTEDVTTIFDTHVAEDILNHSYEADLQFFLAPRGSNAENEAAYRKAEELFYQAKNNTGYLAKRFGFPWNEEYTWRQPRQHVDLFKVKADLPKVVSEDAGPILLNVRYIPQGEASSGATAGRIRYEWEGEPHNSPSVKILDDHIYAYEWEGEPHNSPSVKRVDGVEVARNEHPSPRGGAAFTRGGEYSTVYDAATLGPDWLNVPGFSVPGLRDQEYAAIRAEVIAIEGAEDISFRVYRGGATNPLQTLMPGESATWTMHGFVNDYVFIASPASVGIVAYVRFFLATADSEQAALDQVAEYFDGDTPAQSGEVVARNLISNPSFELGTDSVAGTSMVSVTRRGTRVDRVSAGSWHLWPEITLSGSGLAYIYQNITDLSPGDWLAASVDVGALSGQAERAGLRFGFLGGAGGREYQWVHNISDVRFDKHTLSGAVEVPDSVSSAWVMLYLYPEYPNSYFTENASYYTDAWHASVGATEEEALAQVQHYFDGDSVDK